MRKTTKTQVILETREEWMDTITKGLKAAGYINNAESVLDFHYNTIGTVKDVYVAIDLADATVIPLA